MSQRQKILIVDDEPDIRELLEITLGRMKLDTRSAKNLAEAQSLLEGEAFDLCLTDMRLPDGTGLEVIAEITAKHPTTPVAMITAFGNVEAAVNALKAGAFDFVTKPVDLTVLRRLVQNALDLGEQRKAQQPAGNRLVGDSPRMQQLRATIANEGAWDAGCFFACLTAAGIAARQATMMMFPKGAYGQAMSGFLNKTADRVLDMSEADFGVALINDCKYGYDAHEQTVRLTLVRPTAGSDSASNGSIASSRSRDDSGSATWSPRAARSRRRS